MKIPVFAALPVVICSGSPLFAALPVVQKPCALLLARAVSNKCRCLLHYPWLRDHGCPQCGLGTAATRTSS